MLIKYNQKSDRLQWKVVRSLFGLFKVEKMIPKNDSYAEQIMLHCLLVNDYLTTVKKALMADGQDVEGFVDHYSDLIETTLSVNWQIHEAAELISREDFRRNLKLD